MRRGLSGKKSAVRRLEDMMSAAAWTLESERRGREVGRRNAVSRQNVSDDVDVRIGTPINKRSEVFTGHGSRNYGCYPSPKRRRAAAVPATAIDKIPTRLAKKNR